MAASFVLDAGGGRGGFAAWETAEVELQVRANGLLYLFSLRERPCSIRFLCTVSQTFIQAYSYWHSCESSLTYGTSTFPMNACKRLP